MPARKRFGATPVIEKPKQTSEQLSLRMIFAPALAYVALFSGKKDKGSITRDELRHEIRGLLDESGQEAIGAGYSAEIVGQVRFALVAFIDEVVARSDWDYRSAWMEKPLQSEEFGTTAAGDQFFEPMADGSEIDPELAEIKFVILSLGFQGRYVESKSDLVNARHALFNRFPRDAVASLAQLSPEAYSESVEGLEIVENPWIKRRWLVAGGAAILTAVIYGLLQWKLSGVVADYRDLLQALRIPR